MTQLTKLNYLNALKSGWLLIFLANISYRFIDQKITLKLDTLIRSVDGINSSLWAYIGLSLIVGLLFPLIMTLLCCYFLMKDSKSSLTGFISENLELLSLETLRSWGIGLLWALALIIPGVIKMSFLIMVPYIVLFSTEYKNGFKDALDFSTVLSKHFYMRINIYLTVVFFIIPSVITFAFDDYAHFADHPFWFCLIYTFEALAILWFHFMALKLLGKYIKFHPLPENTNRIHGGEYVTNV